MKNQLLKFIYRAILLIYLSFTMHLCSAQTAPTAPKRVDVYMQLQENDTTMHRGDKQFHENTQLTATMYILLADSSAITGFHVKLGIADGYSDLFEKEFNNVQGTFIDGTSFTQKGNKIYIGLGNYIGINTFYGEVYLINDYGSSSVVKYAKK